MHSNVVNNVSSLGNMGEVDFISPVFYNVVPNTTTENLHVFPPQPMHDQIQRTNRYNFSEAFVDSINSANPERYTGNLSMAPDSVRDSIIPTHQYEEVNVNPYRERWSFILTIDTANIPGTIIETGGPSTRTAMIGYFEDEPMMNVMSTTPLVNPNAKLIVTHMDAAKLQTVHGMNGSYTDGGMLASSDILHQQFDKSYAPIMSMTDVASLAHGHQTPGYSNGAMVPSGNEIKLSDLTLRGSHIKESSKAPLSQLREISSAAQITHNLCGGADASKFNDSTIEAEAQTALMGKLQKKSFHFELAKLLDPTVPFRIQELGGLFPNLAIQYCEIASPPVFDQLDPRSNTLASIYSAMISNTTSAYAKDMMLANIEFRYDSWCIAAPEGLWKIEPTFTSILPTSNTSKLVSDIAGFKLLMETGLFPILKGVFGHFTVIVKYDGSGDTQVIITEQGIPAEGAFMYHNRLGGLINPSLGTEEMYISNTNQFAGLVGAVVSDVSGSYEPNNGLYGEGGGFLM